VALPQGTLQAEEESWMTWEGFGRTEGGDSHVFILGVHFGLHHACGRRVDGNLISYAHNIQEVGVQVQIQHGEGIFSSFLHSK